MIKLKKLNIAVKKELIIDRLPGEANKKEKIWKQVERHNIKMSCCRRSKNAKKDESREDKNKTEEFVI